MLTTKISPSWIISLFILLSIITCTDESDSIGPSNESLSRSDIIGTWFLSEIRYDSSGTSICLFPEDGNMSLTLKLWYNNQGQILSFDSCGGNVQNINWNLQGSTIILSSDDITEYIRCKFIDQYLSMDYSFTSLSGEQYLALYLFTKEQ